ncbi:hypothetical protein CALCODRAFT_200309 [Calocera cornea HHB12733]|uniref:Uncharacterized protein n=1 Tax=Calocera cornea HHB12733 TaxID=1353952 RepID=A0A165HH17_9BASI|nr:hypothetical protein CALCODRAFT_200309 [Calocera cornea HHB12733]
MIRPWRSWPRIVTGVSLQSFVNTLRPTMMLSSSSSDGAACVVCQHLVRLSSDPVTESCSLARSPGRKGTRRCPALCTSVVKPDL